MTLREYIGVMVSWSADDYYIWERISNSIYCCCGDDQGDTLAVDMFSSRVIHCGLEVT